MPGKHAKNKGYIELSPDEWNIVTAQKVVEDYWFNNPKGWWDGPDGMGLHPTLGVEVPYLHYPGIRNAMVAAGVEEPYLPAADWLLAEYVHSSQMPRCVPTAINGFIELYFGSHYTLFGHQLGMYYSPQRYNIVIGGRGAGKCLVKGTLVTMADATEKPIAEVQIGDRVVTVDVATLKPRRARVAMVMRQPAKPLRHIVTHSGRNLRCSFDHPILTPAGWVQAWKIEPDTQVAELCAGGRNVRWVAVVANEAQPAEPLWDLTVEDDHNFVANGIVVHNTIPLAIIMMIWTALHPGEPWLHVALSLDQAKKAYNAILDMAARRHYRSDGTMTARSFAEVFIQDKREFPQTDIYFRPWDEHDGGEIAGKQQAGNTIMFRSLGDEDLERLRSTEAGEGSGDEILREVHDSKTVNHIRGCLRGLNPWLMAHLPQKHRQRINELQQMIGIGNVTGNDELVERCENELLDFKVGRMKRFYAIGNAGEPDWVWEVMDMAEEKPHYAWFIQVSMYDNIRLSPEDRAALEEAWGTDPEARQVELLGRRPLGLGTEIDPQLLMSAVRGERHGELSELGGRIIQEHPAHGIIHYVKLPTQGHFHVIAGDPGKDKLPRRNSWCVMVVDITANPAEVVFFQMGNLNARSKTYVPYTNAYKFAAQTYPVVSPADMIYDNGGQQSGMHEVLLGSLKEKSPTVDEELERDGFDVFGNPYDMTNSMKHTAANWLIDLLRKGALIMPELRILVRQTSNWSLPDKKIAQDSTMTLFMLVYRMYYIISDRSLGYGIEQEPSSPWNGDGNSGWQMPDDAGVLHNVSKELL